MTEKDEWQRHMLYLSTALTGGMWEIGDLYLEGRQAFGAGWCKSVVTSPNWRGIEYPTIQVYASVARRFPPLIRIKGVAPALHQLAAPLPDEIALPLLRKAAAESWNVNKLRQEVRHIRFFQDLVGGQVVDDLARLIAEKRRYRAILADPPWPWNTAGGRAGSTSPYYHAMTMTELYGLPVEQVATDDAFLFLWVPPALLESSGLPLMRAWGFPYKTNVTWDKGDFGRGAYVRTVHEHLLIGVRDKTPTHFIDNAVLSMIRVPSTRNNSEKPVETHQIVERATNGPFLELFARRHVPKWDCYGNQLAPIVKPDEPPHLLAAD